MNRFQVCSVLATLCLGSLFANEESLSLDTFGFSEERAEIALTPRAKRKEAAQTNDATCAVPVQAPMVPSLPCPDRYRISADFLYLLPTLDDTYFVIENSAASTAPTGTRKNNDFGFNPGFRVGLEYALCPNQRELQAFYSYLNADQSRTVSGDHLWATTGRADMASGLEDYSGFASSKSKLLYQRFEANLLQQIGNYAGVYFYLQPGLDFAYLRLSEDTHYQITGGALGELHQKSRDWGLGPQMGIGFDYNFYNGCRPSSIVHTFSFTSFFAGSILMGEANTKIFNSMSGSTIVDIHDESTWRVIPALHARTGLNYTVRGCRVGASFGIGYEFNSYIRALTRVIFPDDVADSSCFNNYYNFDIQGLYISAALSF